MKSVLVLGFNGFIGSAICEKLLKSGYLVTGIDNDSKYGWQEKPFHKHENFDLITHDVRRIDELDLFNLNYNQIEYVINLAAKIGGIKFFNKYAADIIAENAEIDAAILRWSIKHDIKQFIGFSSSMVYESAKTFPTSESDSNSILPPVSSYGFSKLMTERSIKAFHEQYGLNYTIIRPFNASGVGETDFQKGESHVIPELTFKCLSGQDPLEIRGNGNQIRCYTNVADIARAVELCIDNPDAMNNDFNISVPEPTTVLQLAEKIWNKVNPNKQFNYICLPSYENDVQMRIPNVTKAENVLGFKAEISLDDSIDEVIQFVSERMKTQQNT